jgi:dihydrolipoamide dehydrogenase
VRIRAAQLGLKTACVEARCAWRTCLNVGCIPSKALLQSSHLYEEAAHGLAAHGVKVNGAALDLPTMMSRKDKVVRPHQGRRVLFNKQGRLRQGRGAPARREQDFGRGQWRRRTDD